MALIREFAPAKINLTLDVAGRRPDGLHELRSLVGFASVGDWVSLDAGNGSGVDVFGPFAGGLSGPNILDRALALLRDRAPRLALGAVHLEKLLPVASGVGGGSADACALLRAVRRANGALGDDAFWREIAEALGADVPACLASRPLWMGGIGHETLEIEGGVPSLEVVLVNPLVPVPSDKTARVFRALGAGPVADGFGFAEPPAFADRAALVRFMAATGNHLSTAAEAVVPEIGQVLAALRGAAGIEHAAVSGAGPTCFGVFRDSGAAETTREMIASAHPAWWVVATTVG